jgi:hypothetical protein
MRRSRILSVLFVGLLGAVAHVAVGQAVSVGGLVAYWRFDETSGPSLDSSGGNHTATWTNAVASNLSVPAGPPGTGFPNPNCVDFNGTSAYVNNGTFSWPTGGPITIAFWSFVPSPDQNSVAFTVGNLDQPNRCQAHAPWSDGNLYWDYGDINNNGRISTSYVAKMDKWTHVVLVSAGVGGAFRGIYLDGALANSATTSNGPTVALTGVRIGHGNAGGYHKGRIDDFRIYNRVLTATEVTTLHQGALPGAFTVTAVDAVAQVDLSWTASSGAASYEITRVPTAGGTPVSLANQTATTYSDTTGTPGVSYTYTVVASNVVGTASASDTGTPLVPPPPPPRFDDHEEGLVDGACGCGTLPVLPGAFAAIAGAAALLAALRRR